jgi:hypothetical protein
MGLSQSQSIAVILRETRYEKLVGRWATASAAKFRLKLAHAHERELPAGKVPTRGKSATKTPTNAVLKAAEFDEYEEENVAYRKTIDELRRELDLGYPLKFIDRSYLPTFDFRGCVLAVVVGQDGLVANAAKYVGDLPIVAINPDPQRIDGILLPFEIRRARRAVQRTLEGKAKVRQVTLAEVNLNDGQRMLAFNDFFLGCNSHVSARYTLQVTSQNEAQSSSGIIIATGAGSTGWLSSIFNMVDGFAVWMGHEPLSHVQMNWEDRRLIWAVREPFKSKCTSASLVAGKIDEPEEMIVESLMPTNGVIFSDGVESDFLEFNSGSIARIKVSQQRAHLVVG